MVKRKSTKGQKKNDIQNTTHKTKDSKIPNIPVPVITFHYTKYGNGNGSARWRIIITLKCDFKIMNIDFKIHILLDPLYTKFSDLVDWVLLAVIVQGFSRMDNSPHSTIFQQYRGSQVYCWRKPDLHQNATDLSNIVFSSSCIEYISPKKKKSRIKV